MNAVFATIDWTGRPADPGVLNAAIACMRYRCPDGGWTWRDGAVGMAQAELATLPEDQPGVHLALGTLHIAADCRIDNRDELRQLLHEPLPPAAPDALFVLAAYRQWGAACVDRLVGEFAFVIWDAAARRVFAARDLSGTCRLFFFRDAQRLIIASERTQILQDPTVPLEIDDDQLLDYFTPAYQWTSGWDQGLFRGFEALPAGYILQAEAGHVATRRFWDWRDHTPADRPAQQVLEEYRHALEQAIRCRLRSRKPAIALELSGGLDSTAVVALAARMNSGHELHTFSLVFDQLADPAERQRIDLMIAHFGLRAHLITADNLYTPEYVTSNWQPQSVAGPQELEASVAAREEYSAILQADCNVVLTGLMGDSVNEGCERVYYDLLRRKQFREVLRRLGLSWQRDSRRAAGALLYYGLMPFAPWAVLRPALVWQELRRGMYTDLPAFIAASLQQRIATRDRSLRVRKVQRLGERSPAVRYTLEEIMTPMIASTLPSEYPLEFRHPFYDRRLVELVLAMPQEEKWNHDGAMYKERERWHHRRAMQGILPEAVLNQPSGMDFAAAVKHGLAAEHILPWLDAAPRLEIAERGYVEARAFRQAVIEPGRYYSYMGALLVTEAWLRALAPGGAMRRLIPQRQPFNGSPSIPTSDASLSFTIATAVSSRSYNNEQHTSP